LKKFLFFSIHIVLPILIGAFIYVLFRVETLLVFKWIQFLGLDTLVYGIRSNTLKIANDLPFFFLYALPDGLWVYAGTTLFFFIWEKEIKGKIAIFWISLIFSIAVIAEFLQKLDVVEGTFCKYDIIAYISGFMFSVLFNYHRSINYE